jgi:hypothetical protein
MKMTKDQRSNYRMLVAEAKGTLKRLNDAVRMYNEATEAYFGEVEDCEHNYADALAACDGFASTMMNEPTAEKSWGKFCFSFIDHREAGPFLGEEEGGVVDVFATLEKRR